MNIKPWSEMGYIEVDIEDDYLDGLEEPEDRSSRDDDILDYASSDSSGYEEYDPYELCNDPSRDYCWYHEHEEEPSFIDYNYDGIDDRYQ